MSIFPFINVDSLQNPINEPLPMYREIAWDFNKNEPVVVNGNFKIIEGNEAIKVWCYKSILTPRFEHLIYSWNYGSDALSLIGKNYSKGLVEAELKRYITEALMINPYIIQVNVIDTEFNDSLLSANIEVKTIYGDTEVSI